MSQTICIENLSSPEITTIEDDEVEEQKFVPVVWNNSERGFKNEVKLEEIPHQNPYQYANNPSGAARSGSLSIPANNNWEGEYGFRLVFMVTGYQTSSKSVAWAYSSTLGKVFTTMNVPFPLHVQVSKIPPQGSTIRVMAVYSLEQHAAEVVTRCIFHAQPDDQSNRGHPAPEHILRCDHPNTVYKTDPETGRQFILVPYNPPDEGATFTTYLFRVMCLGSCNGGINRRPLFLVLSLMHNHHCLGRCVLPIRSCASPRRDRIAEEKKVSSGIADQRIQHTTKRGGDCSPNNCSPKLPRVDSLNSDSDEETEFILRVKGRTSYEILSKLNDALQLVKLLTPSQIKAYHDLQKQVTRSST